MRFELGAGSVVAAIEEGVAGMAEGGVRQLVVPNRPGLGYPPSDPKHEKVGPRPSTFSGQRALNFVLQNQDMIDKTCASREPSRTVRALRALWVPRTVSRTGSSRPPRTRRLLFNVKVIRVDKPGQNGWKV